MGAQVHDNRSRGSHAHKNSLEREVSERRGAEGVEGTENIYAQWQRAGTATSSFCINELFDVQKQSVPYFYT